MQTVDQAVRNGPDRDVVIDPVQLHRWISAIRLMRAWQEQSQAAVEEDRRDAEIALTRIRRQRAWLMAGRLCRPTCAHHRYCPHAGAAVFCNDPSRMDVKPAVYRLRCSAAGCDSYAEPGDIYCARCIEELEARSWQQPRDLDRGFWAVLAAAATIIVFAGLLAGCVR